MSTENRFSEDKDKLSLVPVLQQSGRYQAQRPYQQDYLECAIRIKVSIGSNNIERS